MKTAFKSALKPILTCKDLINSAVECDPTGHAAAEWALVSFGLQMTQNELDRQQNVLEAYELLAGILQLAAFEHSYRIKAVQIKAIWKTISFLSTRRYPSCRQESSSKTASILVIRYSILSTI